MTSKEFKDRITSDGEGVKITPPKNPGETQKFYVTGPAGRKPTREEALAMGRELFDRINSERAKDARASED